MDLPRLQALNAYWTDHPPLHLMVSAYLGVKPKEKNISEAAEFVPVTPLPTAEFDAILKQHGIPT